MYKLVRGISMECKGYRLPSSEEEFHKKKSRRLGKCIKLISPDGSIIDIKNVSEFCRNQNLNRNNFQCMITGRIKSYRGWKLCQQPPL